MRRIGVLGLRLIVALVVILGVGGAVWLIVHREMTTISEPDADPVEKARHSGRPSIVEFGSASCHSCREMKTVMEQLEREHGAELNVIVVDLLSSKGRPLIRKYGIAMMPTQVVFAADGVEVARNIGPIEGGVLLELLNGPRAVKGSGS